MASRIEIHMKPQGPVLDEYMSSMSRISMIMGPLGSGKTFQSCQKVLKLMCNQEPNKEGVRPSRFYGVRNTYPDLMSTTIKDWMELFGELGKFKHGGMEPPTHRIKFKLEDGTTVRSELVFIALDRLEHVKKLRGAQVTGFWLNETKELAKPIVDMADLRHGRYPSLAAGGVNPTWHGMIGDYNAPDDDHWIYRLAEEEMPEGWSFFKQPGGVIRNASGSWVVNPDAENVNNLPDGYYVRGMEGKSDDWISVNLGNNYGTVIDGKPIYTEYNDRIHCSETPLKIYRGLPLIMGFDFGLTPACIINQVTPRGQFRTIRELIAEGMGMRQFLQLIVKPALANEFPGMKYIVKGDPAGTQRSQSDEKTCYDELRGAGLQAEPARTNAFNARREAVAAQLTRMIDGEPGYLLDPSCRMLRRGFNGGYKYRRLQVPGDERFTETADKNKYSHPHDGLQYAALHVDNPVKQAKSRHIPQAHTRPADKTAGY